MINDITSVGTKKRHRGKTAVYSSGDRYGYLTLTGKSFFLKAFRQLECICDCGKIWFTAAKDIFSGRNRSCGCRRNELISDALTKHGQCVDYKIKTTYSIWNGMKQRCYNENSKKYSIYGGRGITVCDRWIDSFKNFLEDMGERPSSKHSLDRIEGNSGYYKENCRWATIPVQNRNKSTNVFIEAWGETKCLQDWANDERAKVCFNTISYRIKKKGWSAEDAISHPVISNAENRSLRKNSIVINQDGKRYTLTAFCSLVGLSYNAVTMRMYKKGETAVDAIKILLKKHNLPDYNG